VNLPFRKGTRGLGFQRAPSGYQQPTGRALFGGEVTILLQTTSLRRLFSDRKVRSQGVWRGNVECTEAGKCRGELENDAELEAAEKEIMSIINS